MRYSGCWLGLLLGCSPKAADSPASTEDTPADTEDTDRPEESEGVPILMDVATTAEDANTRRSAMFWLAQAEDPRVLDFFEEVLLGRR